jgi:prepilin-type processing-associated H-X9-DG protein
MAKFTREPEAERVQPTSTSGLAIASLLLSLCLPAVGGLFGIVLGIMALAQINSSEGRMGGRGLAISGIVLGIIWLLLGLAALPVAMLIPAISRVRGAAERMQSSNNLKQIGIAVHMYNDTYTRFPAAAIKDKDGKPLLSWRVAILPYIEQDNLYRMFKLDEPWDSPHNSKLIPMMPQIYLVPGDPVDREGMTRYRIFVGPGTMFEDLAKGMTIADVTDGSSNTLLVVEARDPVIWTKPDELPFEPGGDLPLLGTEKQGGFNVLMADGSVMFLKLPGDQPTLRLMIQRNDNKPIDMNKLQK